MRAAPSLRELANKHGSDKGSTVFFRHDYTALYDQLLYPYRLQRLNILEIGLAVGGPEGGGPIERRAEAPSISMWLDYFPYAQIFGFDISDFSHIVHPRFQFVRGDLGSSDDLLRLAGVSSHFDIIFDDGSHASYHQQLALNCLFDRLAPGGIYVIEDLHWQSPNFEEALPVVPKTGQLLYEAFVEKAVTGSAALPSERLRAIVAATHSSALFPSFNGDGFTRKMAILRKAERPPEDIADTRQRVRSYDLFDTLIARRCHGPLNVFDEIERRASMPGFAQHRQAAEATLYGTAYGLQDIYRAVARVAALDDDACARLLKLELEVEREMLFPIAETCAAFRPGDIVVSDMYLPHAYLEGLVETLCHLPAGRVYVSPQGKRNGEIWPVIMRDFNVTEHVGDNEITDVWSARNAGITPRLTTLSTRTAVETDLADAGYEPLANLVREARLRSWAHNPGDRQIQLLQVELNFPLLFVATLRLIKIAGERGWRRLLFSGRDCFLWNELYATLAPLLGPAPVGTYFHSSRIARVNPSADYLEYLASLLADERSAIVDLVGTGWSLNRLLERAHGQLTDIFLIHQLEVPDIRADYERHAAVQIPIAPVSILHQPPAGGSNEVVEELNRAPFPLLHDIVATRSGFRPVFAPTTGSAPSTDVLRVHHAAFRDALSLSYDIGPEAMAAMGERNHEAMIRRLYGAMEGQGPLVAHFYKEKCHEESLFRVAIENAREAVAT